MQQPSRARCVGALVVVVVVVLLLAIPRGSPAASGGPSADDKQFQERAEGKRALYQYWAGMLAWDKRNPTLAQLMAMPSRWDRMRSYRRAKAAASQHSRAGRGTASGRSESYPAGGTASESDTERGRATRAAASSAASEITVVLNVFNRLENFRNQLDGIVAASVPIHEIWVCAFASPFTSQFAAVIDQFNSEHFGAPGSDALTPYPPVKLISSDINLKYYGRFQMGMQARTKYVVFVDDDIVPGRRFLEQCLHVINIPGYRSVSKVCPQYLFLAPRLTSRGTDTCLGL